MLSLASGGSIPSARTNQRSISMDYNSLWGVVFLSLAFIGFLLHGVWKIKQYNIQTGRPWKPSNHFPVALRALRDEELLELLNGSKGGEERRKVLHQEAVRRRIEHVSLPNAPVDGYGRVRLKE